MLRFRFGLAARVATLGAVFLLEKIFLNEFVDFDRAQAAEGLGAVVRYTQHWGFRFIVALIAAITLFAGVSGGEKLKTADAAIRAHAVRIRWLIVHTLCAVLLIPLTYLLYRDDSTQLPFAVIAALWMALGATAALSATVAMAPWPAWRQAAAALGAMWWYALIAALLSASAMHLSQQLWGPTTAFTFDLVRRLLAPIIPALSADPATRILSTSHFAVEVSELCSGLEGVGLILAFFSAWLLYFRREYIFPRALLLIPVGVAAIFALNVLRIALLFLIGDAGFADVAIYGFHSQAGWIAFIVVACGMVLLSRRSTWLNRTAIHANSTTALHNPTAAYLMPLLAILAAGAVSRAISSDFEFFYPLRVIACLSMLIRYRRKLATIDWQWSWRGPTVGVLVFLVWIGAGYFLLSRSPMPEKLAELPMGLRGLWIASRLAGSVLLVPVAEELAYRGYLMRRLMSEDFESVPFQAVRWVVVGTTAVVFGLAHGALWLPGIVAGLAFSLLLVRRGHLGESVMAHATTNALIAGSVLLGGQWQLW